MGYQVVFGPFKWLLGCIRCFKNIPEVFNGFQRRSKEFQTHHRILREVTEVFKKFQERSKGSRGF